MLPSALLFLLVGGFVWASGEKPTSSPVVVENPTGETLHADIVWRAPGGTVFGTLLRSVDARSALRYPVRPAVEGCVRWIQDGSVRAAWPVDPGMGQRSVQLHVKEPASPRRPGSCSPELVEHRVRPVLGRWLLPGEPDRLYRERLISRTLHRRGWQAEDGQRRNRGLLSRESDPDVPYAVSSRSGRSR